MLALIDNIGFTEMMIVLVVALLIFGKRLPEVAGQAGAQLAKLRRAFEDMKQETGIDREIRKVKRDLEDAIPPEVRNMSIGEMARKASAEMEKRLAINEAIARGSQPATPATNGSVAANSAPESAATPSNVAQAPAETPSAAPSSAIPPSEQPRKPTAH